MRIPIIAGNWKMNKTASEAMQYVNKVKELLPSDNEVEAVVIPPDLFIQEMIQEATESSLKIGAQNCYFKESGSYTGETSPAALSDVGVTYVIVGHSERRQYFGETDAQIGQKVDAILSHKMAPIICVGETLEERNANQTEEKVGEQVTRALKGVEAHQVKQCVIAYEPIWAIGSGKTASPDEANQTAMFIRKTIANIFTPEVADAVRIQYGGSVTPKNIGEFLKTSDLDGALVGGASLEAESFLALLEGI